MEQEQLVKIAVIPVEIYGHNYEQEVEANLFVRNTISTEFLLSYESEIKDRKFAQTIHYQPDCNSLRIIRPGDTQYMRRHFQTDCWTKCYYEGLGEKIETLVLTSLMKFAYEKESFRL